MHFLSDQWNLSLSKQQWNSNPKFGHIPGCYPFSAWSGFLFVRLHASNSRRLLLQDLSWQKCYCSAHLFLIFSWLDHCSYLLSPLPSEELSCLQQVLSHAARLVPRLGVIFDTISIKARCEWWCRWNCDLRVINAHKKGTFCRTESFAMMPKSRDHMPGQLELRRRNWYFARETHKDTAVSVWACQAGFWKSTGTSCQLRSKPLAVFHGFCEIALTEVLATQMGVMRRSKKVSCLSCINLIHFRLTAGRLRRSSCIVIPGVVCELLQFAATQ